MILYLIKNTDRHIMGFWIELTTRSYIGCKVKLMLNLKYATPTLLLISEHYNNNNNIALNNFYALRQRGTTDVGKDGKYP